MNNGEPITIKHGDSEVSVWYKGEKLVPESKLSTKDAEILNLQRYKIDSDIRWTEQIEKINAQDAEIQQLKDKS